MPLELRLYKDEIAPAAAVLLPARADAISSLYVVSGGLRIAAAGLCGVCGTNSALHVTNTVQLTGGSLTSVVLRWELAAAGSPQTLLSGTGVSSKALLSASLALPRTQSYLLRCDRVDFPPKGEAFLHTHQGGGIRCLLFGGIEIETKGARHAYGPLGAWFEAGPDPVYAGASATEPSAFVRLMVLPRALLGKSSLSYVNAEDQAKPKSQCYQVFIDAPIELP